MENISVLLKIRVLFWPEISALGVFFNVNNERMRPLITQVPQFMPEGRSNVLPLTASCLSPLRACPDGRVV